MLFAVETILLRSVLLSEFWCYSQRFTTNYEKPIREDLCADVTNQNPDCHSWRNRDGIESIPFPIQGQSVDILNQQNIKAINGHSVKRLHNLNLGKYLDGCEFYEVKDLEIMKNCPIMSNNNNYLLDFL